MAGLKTVLRMFLGLLGIVVVMGVVSAPAQQGNSKSAEPPPRVNLVQIPPAPPLTPDQALQSFKLVPGMRIELVAHEPMVELPVAMAFDADGRLWVAEMRGFMPNVQGQGEEDIPGRIVTLEDTDGDGRMDRRTVFLDHLVMPRALAMAGEGLLVAEPPHLWFCRDTNGDGVCDEKTAIASDYGDRKNPEHTANGLVRGLDNWYYSLYHTNRYRFVQGAWERQASPNRVQWGLSQDNVGRMFFTSNSDQLRGDLVPPHYAGCVASVKFSGLNATIATNQTVFPGRVNPGVNRGYEPGILRENGTLARFTAACGTVLYRGDLLPPEFVGNAFVCEPAGNLIRRNLLTEQDGAVAARNAYEQDEFLTSTDERFRPVNLANGPDGALYVADLYHGIVEHRIYVTPYLRDQIQSRGLDKELFQGRIYRIVPEAKRPGPPVRLAKASSHGLLQQLAHANGWVRDTAQRLLVERADPSVAEPLRAMAATHPDALARLHALWTLEGMHQTSALIVSNALRDPSPFLRAAALRLSESVLNASSQAAASGDFLSQVLALSEDPSAMVQRQLALTLGAVPLSPEVKDTLMALGRSSRAEAREAATFSLGLREPKAAPAPKAPQGRPLTKEEQARFEAGREIYELTCIACHQAHGLGQEGLAPPLVGSEWVGYSPQRLARLVLHGLRGPIKVKGQTYEIDMPPLAVLDDDQIAAVLTFVRRQWGHTYDPVEPVEVKKVRAMTEDREGAWTSEELLRIP